MRNVKLARPNSFIEDGPALEASIVTSSRVRLKSSDEEMSSHATLLDNGGTDFEQPNAAIESDSSAPA